MLISVRTRNQNLLHPVSTWLLLHIWFSSGGQLMWGWHPCVLLVRETSRRLCLLHSKTSLISCLSRRACPLYPTPPVVPDRYARQHSWTRKMVELGPLHNKQSQLCFVTSACNKALAPGNLFFKVWLTHGCFASVDCVSLSSPCSWVCERVYLKGVRKTWKF